jgi:hypothetical protein
MATTVLGGVLDFFKELGVYDVVLPFILVFTIMFAILEKTKVFGTEGEKKFTKKNLNAMVSFVIAFLVVASSKIVEAITKVSSEIIVLLLLVVFFLMMVGTFYTKEEIDKGVSLDKWWRTGFMIFIAISILFIFLDAIVAEDGRTWLEVFWDWLSNFYTDTSVAAIVLIIAVIIFVYFVTKGKE